MMLALQLRFMIMESPNSRQSSLTNTIQIPRTILRMRVRLCWQGTSTWDISKEGIRPNWTPMLNMKLLSMPIYRYFQSILFTYSNTVDLTSPLLMPVVSFYLRHKTSGDVLNGVLSSCSAGYSRYIQGYLRWHAASGGLEHSIPG